MQTFWSRNGEGASVDKVRGNPGDDACDGPARRYRRLLRPALAASSAAMLIVAFGVVGGPGYAASAKHSVANVINVFQAPTRGNDVAKNAGADTTSQNAATNNTDASKHDQRGGDDHGGGGGHGGDDDDQYRPGKGCGDDNHVHSRHNECHDHGGHGGHHHH